jgi:2-hydroxy-3-keto-5-methylthiopentenyl-1-phosphate phosphatase
VTPDGDETVTAGPGGQDAAAGALEARRSLVLDFDGTITEVDLLDEVATRFGDPKVYRQVEGDLLAGTITLRDCITREFAPVRAPLDEVVRWVLGGVRVRAGFAELVALARSQGWSTLVLSSGFHELIEPVLAREGIEVEVKANRLDARENGWRVLWRDASVCPVCGEPCKRAALPPNGEIVYVGDGYSDRCAALASQRVFATRGLARYLDDQETPYEPFSDFTDVAAALRAG